MPSLKAADRARLRAEIETDPNTLGYAGRTPAEVYAILTTADRPRLRRSPCLVNELDILDAFDEVEDGDAFLDKLEAVAGVNGLVARVLKWMGPTAGERGDKPGIDIANAKVRATLAGLVGVANITQAEVDAMLDLGIERVDRLLELGLHGVRPGHVVVAMEG